MHIIEQICNGIKAEKRKTGFTPRHIKVSRAEMDLIKYEAKEYYHVVTIAMGATKWEVKILDIPVIVEE